MTMMTKTMMIIMWSVVMVAIRLRTVVMMIGGPVMMIYLRPIMMRRSDPMSP